MAVAHFSMQGSSGDDDVRLNLDTHFSTSNLRKVVAELQSLSHRGVYMVSDYLPRPGDVLQVGGDWGSDGGFLGSVDYVERLGGSRWGFFVSFEQEPAPPAEVRPFPVRDSRPMGQPEGLRPEAFEYYDRLTRVRDYVRDHYSEEISLESAASEAALEKTYFSTFFHEKVGVTFRDFLQHFRVQKAMQLIRTDNQSLTDVAYSSGFGDLRTFQRAFRKWAGMTPREYKKQTAPGN